MKLFLILMMITGFAHTATCTQTTRTNYTTGQVLNSAALNADFNQLVTKANAFDGGCVSDGTLEITALNFSDFATLLSGIAQGCKVSYSDSNTLSVGKCMLSINGSMVNTTVANTVTWGCTSCSSEVVSTTYYLYAKNGSTGTTLNLLISTTAPGENGYDASSNKVLAKFYNNASSDIDSWAIDNWVVNKFSPSNTAGTAFTPTYIGIVVPSPSSTCIGARVGGFLEANCSTTLGTNTGSIASASLPSGLRLDTSRIVLINDTSGEGQSWGNFSTNTVNEHGWVLTAPTTSTTAIYFGGYFNAAAASVPKAGSTITDSIKFHFRYRVPIVGWSDY